MIDLPSAILIQPMNKEKMFLHVGKTGKVTERPVVKQHPAGRTLSLKGFPSLTYSIGLLYLTRYCSTTFFKNGISGSLSKKPTMCTRIFPEGSMMKVAGIPPTPNFALAPSSNTTGKV